MPDDSMEYEELLAVAQHLWADNQNLYAMNAKIDEEANMHKRRCDVYIIRRNALATKVGKLDEENAGLRALARMYHTAISSLCDSKTVPDEADVLMSKTWLEDFQIKVEP